MTGCDDRWESGRWIERRRICAYRHEDAGADTTAVVPESFGATPDDKSPGRLMDGLLEDVAIEAAAFQSCS
jgi:hypothetical protein